MNSKPEAFFNNNNCILNCNHYWPPPPPPPFKSCSPKMTLKEECLNLQKNAVTSKKDQDFPSLTRSNTAQQDRQERCMYITHICNQVASGCCWVTSDVFLSLGSISFIWSSAQTPVLLTFLLIILINTPHRVNRQSVRWKPSEEELSFQSSFWMRNLLVYASVQLLLMHLIITRWQRWPLSYYNNWDVALKGKFTQK